MYLKLKGNQLNTHRVPFSLNIQHEPKHFSSYKVIARVLKNSTCLIFEILLRLKAKIMLCFKFLLHSHYFKNIT
jgi:hypothetical protein